MASNEKQIINKFINVLWKWIRETDTPELTDNEMWDCITGMPKKLVDDFEKEYRTTEPMHEMFVKMANDYVEYMAKMARRV